MKSPRKRRGARAAAHSASRDAAPADSTQNAGRTGHPLETSAGLAPLGSPGRTAGFRGALLRTDLRKGASDRSRVDIQGRSSIRETQTEAHKPFQSIGLYTGGQTLGLTQGYRLLFMFFRSLGLKGS